ncbi:hypothetical protein F5X96DRAFT_631599 [Biscogniauxia mediterranea]|nr:hypothetical protein F5X96DRAFT_631599 [Biscogniauxia mediterranea]
MQRSHVPLLSKLLHVYPAPVNLSCFASLFPHGINTSKQKQKQKPASNKQRTKRERMLQGSEGGPTTSLVRRRGGSGPITSSGSSEPAAPASNNASPPGISPGSPGNSRLGRTRALVQPLTLSCICVLCPLSISLPPSPNSTLSHSCLTLNPPPLLGTLPPHLSFFFFPNGGRRRGGDERGPKPTNRTERYPSISRPA